MLKPRLNRNQFGLLSVSCTTLPSEFYVWRLLSRFLTFSILPDFLNYIDRSQMAAKSLLWRAFIFHWGFTTYAILTRYQAMVFALYFTGESKIILLDKLLQPLFWA